MFALVWIVFHLLMQFEVSWFHSVPVTVYVFQIIKKSCIEILAAEPSSVCAGGEYLQNRYVCKQELLLE